MDQPTLWREFTATALRALEEAGALLEQLARTLETSVADLLLVALAGLAVLWIGLGAG